jgi:integrase
MRRPTALRERAIVMTLLDTGLRSSELCALNFGDVDLKLGKVTIRDGAAGGAPGGRQELHHLPGRRGRRAVWRYLVPRDDKSD